MREIFLTVLKMSITASLIIPVVMLVRFLIRRAPRRYSYLLWMIVGFRLVCPFSFESALSIFNLIKRPEITPQTTTRISDAIQSSQISANAAVSANMPASTATAVHESFDWIQLFAVIWLCGIAALIIYGIISYIAVRRSVRAAVHDEDNIYLTELRNAPFILGFIAPKIYMPYDIDSDSRKYVIAHEQYHIRRKDHIVKLLSYLILSVHWFNPLCWVSFIMLSKDIELSCDEKVISDGAELKAYSKLLLSMAVKKNFPTPAPLAFGEVGVKHRIKNILKWKRPTAWVTLLALIVCTCVVTVCISNANSGEDTKVKENEHKSTETARTEYTYGYDSDSYSYESEFDTGVDISVASPEPESELESLEIVENESETATETTSEAAEITEPVYDPEPTYQGEYETEGYDSVSRFTLELQTEIFSYDSGYDYYNQHTSAITSSPFPVIVWEYNPQPQTNNHNYTLPGIYF